jgi:2-C-methyl-D-erythritol 4-phosphate cytidylyltransferase
MNNMRNIAVILSGGTGTRLGNDIPKQYIEVMGKPIIQYSLEIFESMNEIDGIVICLAEEWEPYIQEILIKSGVTKRVLFSRPGEVRQMTIYNALKTLENQKLADESIVIIHDAARPLVTKELISRCINECKNADGVLPCIPVKDTLYLSKNGSSISSLLRREEVVAGQAPEAFRYDKYLHVHNEMNHEEILKITGSTEIAYKMGLDVHLVEGDEMNFKITTQKDLENFKTILSK